MWTFMIILTNYLVPFLKLITLSYDITNSESTLSKEIKLCDLDLFVIHIDYISISI
jgi:hypothetical protein